MWMHVMGRTSYSLVGFRLPPNKHRQTAAAGPQRLQGPFSTTFYHLVEQKFSLVEFYGCSFID